MFNEWGFNIWANTIVNDFDWRKIQKTLDDNNTGYINLVDTHFLIDLHDRLKEYILASETLTPELELLSDYQEEIGQT